MILISNHHLHPYAFQSSRITQSRVEPLNAPAQRTLATPNDCIDGEEKPFVFNFMTDEFGIETSWSLRHVDQNGRYVGSGPPQGLHYGDLSIY